ncbi:MAG: hypothetical protein PHU12_01275 [Candidatus Aenigmarchaeota archaeon]|nr:hypothetical protein [Candidatus Aenigmarchaeota archaeon]
MNKNEKKYNVDLNIALFAGTFLLIIQIIYDFIQKMYICSENCFKSTSFIVIYLLLIVGLGLFAAHTIKDIKKYGKIVTVPKKFYFIDIVLFPFEVLGTVLKYISKVCVIE